ncbi:glycosyltransferase [Roseobacteraceae bacterium S113]
MSDAVCNTYASFGIRPDILRTSYIGTRDAAQWEHTEPKPRRADGMLHLAFLGYMRRDKGFFFLLNALEGIPDTLLSRVKLTIAARAVDTQTMERIKALSLRLNKLTHFDGYNRDTLDTVLEGVDAGLIPVLWRDNLPQVALEMHARHIPLITADLGGAQELGGPGLTFAAGDAAALRARIVAMLNGNFDHETYWSQARAPLGVSDHIDALMALYGESRDFTKSQSSQGVDT